MPDYFTPGVYVEEFESGPRPMSGVSTSTPGFLGLTQRGPTAGLPQLVTGMADFNRKYGGYLPRLKDKELDAYTYLAYAVEQFFANGGSSCYVMRVGGFEDAKAAKCALPNVTINAKDEGVWGNDIKVKFTKTNKIIAAAVKSGGGYSVKNPQAFMKDDVVLLKTQASPSGVYLSVTQSDNDKVILSEDSKEDKDIFLCSCEATIEVSYGDIVEVYEGVSFNPASPDYIDKKIMSSDIISIETADGKILEAIKNKNPLDVIFPEKPEDTNTVSLKDGADGEIKADALPLAFKGDAGEPGKRKGIQAFLDNNEISLFCAPGVTNSAIQAEIISHCENLKSRFAILDMPKDSTTVEALKDFKQKIDTDYAAVYHPWVQVFDPLDKINILIPPSGSAAGIYARTDTSIGVHKAPANEIVRGITGLGCSYNAEEQGKLNPIGVNVIRSFPGQGIRIWGARTCSSNTLWRYVNVRRLFIYLEESIKANTNWVVFEPNTELLWLRVKRTIDVFLTDVWRSGALAGASPDEAFYVDIGRSTMTQGDIDNGRLICVIGVAPVKPAEFVIFRITQKTLDS